MTTNPTDAPEERDEETGSGPAPRPRPARDARDLGSLRRSGNDRHLAGVAGGLARHFDVDPIIVRVALVVLVFFGGAGLLLYVGGWLFVPEEGSDRAVVGLDARSRTFVLYVITGLAALALLGDTLGHVDVPWQLFFPAVLVLVVLAVRERMWSRHPREQWTPAPARPSSPGRPADATSAPPTGTDYADYAAQVETQVRQRVDEHVQAVTARYATYPPVNPRRRGPILFWFTLALIALAEGTLGIVDLAGAAVAPPAYAALAVAIIGLMLVVGAFWGRAGGLIPLGLVASVVLGGSLAADKWDLDTHSRAVTYAPASTAELRTGYRMGTGDLTVDLTRLSDPAALAGRTIGVDGHVGSVEIIVPGQVAASAQAAVRGPGQVRIFGEGHGGIHPRASGSVAGTLAGEPLLIHADLNVGQITVEQR